MEIKDVRTSVAVSRSRLPGLDYALNPYRGCGHACIYCYSPDVLREKRWKDWGEFVDVKANVPVLLSKQKKKLQGVIGLGTVTDPYQPIEEKRKITRYCLEQLAKVDCTISIQTKSDLVLRDLDILKNMKNIEVGFTVTTMDGELARKLEAGAPLPSRRVAAMKELADAGIRTWAFLGPIIPGMNDSTESLAEVINTVSEAGCLRLLFDRLRLKPLVKKRLASALGKDLEQLATLTADRKWTTCIYKEVERLCGEAGLDCEKAF